MKILLATSSVTPNAGIPSFNRELCSLLNTENRIHLLVDENITEYPGYEKVFTTSGINIYAFKDSSILLNKLLEEKYDVIINSNSHIMSLFAAFMEDTTRIITVSHSLGTMDCDNAAFNNKYIDGIIALSNSCKDYICHRFSLKNSKKVKVVFNSVATVPNSEVIRSAKKKTDVIKIVFAGGSAASKSPDIIIPIIQELCKTDIPFKFYWLGITTPPLKRFQPFTDIQYILPKDKRVIVTGLIPQSEASQIIASCNVFLAPSRREGFPMALLEAMRIGCIPIVSDFKIANREIIQNGKNGYVISHELVRDFVNRLADICKNHTSYHRIYEESYKTFVEELSFPIWRKKLLSVIKGCEISHKTRKKMTPIAFKQIVFSFKLLDKYNLIENHIKEVLPCAIKIYKYYKITKNMSIVKDKGNWRNQLNSRIADFIANVLGQRMNYTIRYYSHRGHLPNFKHPKDLSERILASMLSKDFLKYADYADKVKVRDYVKAKGLENILLKQFGAWEDAKQIPFDQLPNRFILKANNGSGGHYICTDKSKIDEANVIERMNATLKEASHLRNTEPHYCAIKPMILAEELMGDGTILPTDYKFHCIKGKVADVFVVCERESGAKYCTLDTNWKPLPYTKAEFMPSVIPEKPEHLNEMVKLAEKLSSDFEFVRVDLYDFNGKIYFGELTFSPWGGIMNSYSNEGIEIMGRKFEE